MSKQVALITGTSSGFGKLLSMKLAQKGIYVIATMRNASRDTELRQYEDAIEIMEMDVTNHEQVSRVVQEVISRYGKIDILINNAGYAVGGLAGDVDMDVYRAQLETNYFGLVAVTKAVIPFMRERQYGRIINLSSVSGRIGFPGLSPYVSSKFAVEGFTECLRTELLAYGIYVTLIEPGPYKTEIWKKRFVSGNLVDERMSQNIASEIQKAAEGAGDPAEVADLIMKVLGEKYPKLRYLIGKGFKRAFLLRKVVPERWIEKVIVKKITKDSRK